MAKGAGGVLGRQRAAAALHSAVGVLLGACVWLRFPGAVPVGFDAISLLGLPRGSENEGR